MDSGSDDAQAAVAAEPDRKGSELRADARTGVHEEERDRLAKEKGGMIR